MIPSSFATRAIGRDVSITIFTASSLNSGEKLFFGRGKNLSPFQIVHPNGWTVRKARGSSYSFVAALGPGASSWTLLLDAVRLGPDDDGCAVTAAQLREVFARLEAAGQWAGGNPEIIIAMDAGYNATRLAHLLAGLPVIVVARVRSDRVYCRAAPPKARGICGRHARHGAPVRCADPATWGGPAVTQEGETRQGPAAVTAWAPVHQAVHRYTDCCTSRRPVPRQPPDLARPSGPGRPGCGRGTVRVRRHRGEDRVRSSGQIQG